MPGNIILTKNKIVRLFKKIYHIIKSDVILYNCPFGLGFEIDFFFIKLFKKKIIPYFHGTDVRKNNEYNLNKISDYSKGICVYSTPDLKQDLNMFLFRERATQSKFSLNNFESDNLIFSRNDRFKKTNLYFDMIRKSKETFDFLDYFNDIQYKIMFVCCMPENSKLIPMIDNVFVNRLLKTYKKVYGQRSGFKGVSEKEIDGLK